MSDFNQNPHNPYATPNADISEYGATFEYDTTPFYKASGRIGRVRYIAYSMMLSLCLVFAMFLFGVLVVMMIPIIGDAFMWLAGLMYAVMMACSLYVSFAPSIRRLNDLNKTGWISLLYFVPIVNILLYLYLSLARGDEGVNDYGAPAKPPTTMMIVVAVVLPILFLVGIIVAVATALPAYNDYVLTH